ncbi:hypothetical protein E1B28_005093 [Marasmius oreades]|uniref:Dipeptidyl aminopeptidase n=1 Tax=Marasmius oreades TaxID=181124 RepID=A0A9P7V018_9AGAR|nr:uncharacterized protein E1B28_005093 [Marasmius oreades]KAG7097773.1 hypothetical protein E1B28_005093 [Marasmius oreades]
MVRYEALDTEENLSLLEPSEEGPSKPSKYTKRVSLFSTLIYNLRRLSATVFLVIIAVVLVVLWRIFMTVEELEEMSPEPGNSNVGSVFDESRWAPKHRDIQWSTQGSSQVYIYLDQNESFVATDVTKNETRVLAYSYWLKDSSGNPLLFKDWRFSPSMRFVLVKANVANRWHRSKFGNYYIYDLAINSTFPLTEPTAAPSTITAVWAPTEDSIAFVHNNDLYYGSYPFERNDTRRVTYSGSNSIFNGVGDWIYEEEVLFEDRALWWSPDSRKIAFLSFNDSEIETYTLPTYTPPADYQGMRWHSLDVGSLHYPLPGGKNPVVEAHIIAIDSPDHVVSLSRSTEFSVDSVLFEVAWTTSDMLLVKEMSRDAVRGQVLMFNWTQLVPSRPQLEGEVVRQVDLKPGWIECEQTIFPLPSTVLGLSAYLDIVEDREGYKHIAVFESSRSSEPYFITQGKWEVTGKLLGVNEERKTVYFQAAYPTSIQRSILSANIIEKQNIIEKHVSVTPIAEDGYYRADFSPSSDYHLLSYEGPGIPWQKIMTADGDRPLYTLEDNDHLRTIQATEEVHFLTNSYDGFDFNIKEIRPPNMDTSGETKYPVLFTVSGAPSSQIVNLMFRRDWNSGTGYQGRNLRSPVKNRLGRWEARDAINVARAWSSRRYVDSSRIGIWGWSYGAYVALKVLEADAGFHSLVMAVAPVVNWRLYDSVFTERYLGRLESETYASSSVQNVSSFSRAHLLFVHGTADVNVHYDHSVHLLRMLADAGVSNFWFKSFPDADHAMRGSYRELFELMEKFLHEKWNID